MTINESVAESQQRWLAEREWIIQKHSDLAKMALRMYPEYQVPETRIIAQQDWILDTPVDLDSFTLKLDETPQSIVVNGKEDESSSVRPLRNENTRFESYSSAMQHLKPPALFECRPTYRLLDVSMADRTVEFGMTTYFDKLDVARAAEHELAAIYREKPDLFESTGNPIDLLPFRKLIGDPFALGRRPVSLGLLALTIKRGRTASDHSFLLHWRDPAKVAGSGGIYYVVPAGEFQPAGAELWNRYNDFDLWRGIVKEYSEELLGAAEYDSSAGPLDYENWAFYQQMCAARSTGKFGSWVLGFGAAPLTLSVDIMTASVIDAEIFQELFGAAVQDNDEGSLANFGTSHPLDGIPFTADAIHQLLNNEPVGEMAAACLILAWRHRHHLLG